MTSGRGSRRTHDGRDAFEKIRSVGAIAYHSIRLMVFYWQTTDKKQEERKKDEEPLNELS